LDKSETYGSVKLRSVRVAMQLQTRGITSKDVVAFCSSNTLDNSIPIIGATYLGARVANLEPSLSLRHIRHLLSIVTPKIIFVEESVVNLIEESLLIANFYIDIIVLGKSDKHMTLSQLLGPQEKEDLFLPPPVDINDLAVMFFSTGTAGLPKAICHSHYTLLMAASQMQ
jgi:4-coumarate--CoA ligase